MKLVTVASIAAAIGSCHARLSGFEVTNFVTRHAPNGFGGALVYFDVEQISSRGERTAKDRCYGDAVRKSETELGNLSGLCQNNPYNWMLTQKPDGHYQLYIGYVDYFGTRDSPQSALTTYKSYFPFSNRVVTAEQLTPKNAASFFIPNNLNG